MIFLCPLNFARTKVAYSLLFTGLEVREFFKIANLRTCENQGGPGWGHCVVFLGKTVSSHGASRSPPRCINHRVLGDMAHF